MSKPIEELTALMAEFPGIGPRQARRIVQFLLAKESAYRTSLSGLILDIRNQVSQCSVCFRYDDTNGGKICRICGDKNRDIVQLMVVEKDVDIEGIEASGAYKGLYFVLGGLMALTERKKGNVVRTNELLTRIQKNNLGEIIFALSTTAEGDYTARELLKQIATEHSKIKISLLGRGLSVGAEIEYADAETLRNALQNRHQ